MMLAPCLTKTACLCLSLFIQLLFLCSFIISCKFSICLIYRYFPLEMLVRHLEVISCRYEIVPWKDSDSSAQGGWRPWLGASHTSGSWCERGSPPRRLQSIIHCQGLGLAHVGRWAPHIEGDTICKSSPDWRFQVLSALLSDFASTPSKVPLSERRQFTVVCQVFCSFMKSQSVIFFCINL